MEHNRNQDPWKISKYRLIDGLRKNVLQRSTGGTWWYMAVVQNSLIGENPCSNGTTMDLMLCKLRSFIRLQHPWCHTCSHIHITSYSHHSHAYDFIITYFSFRLIVIKKKIRVRLTTSKVMKNVPLSANPMVCGLFSPPYGFCAFATVSLPILCNVHIQSFVRWKTVETSSFEFSSKALFTW